MANTVVQLYDADSNPIDPKSTAEAIYGGVTVPGSSTVKMDLDSLLAQLQDLRRQVSGAEQIENQFSVQTTYATISSGDKTEAMRATYGERFIMPNSAAPYTWKKTIFKWGLDTIGDPMYEIIATALYPETQIMYAHVQASQVETLEGPVGFGDEVNDRNSNSGVKWYSYFPGIDLNHIYGYMSVRHRDAGAQWPSDESGGGWQTHLFAQYPVN